MVKKPQVGVRGGPSESESGVGRLGCRRTGGWRAPEAWPSQQRRPSESSRLRRPTSFTPQPCATARGCSTWASSACASPLVPTIIHTFADRTHHTHTHGLEGKMSLGQAIDALERIESAPQRYHQLAKIASSALTSASCITVFYGGGWADIWLALLLGTTSMAHSRRRISSCVERFGELTYEYVANML